MNNSQLLAILPYLKEKYDFIPYGPFLLELGGYTPGPGGLMKNDDAIDKFNDTVVLVNPTSHGYRLNFWRATIHPGLPWILKPMKGLIGTGEKIEQTYWLRPGLHKKKKALVQDSEILLWRDVNRNGIWTEDEPIQKGTFVNMHYKNSKGILVGWNSASCTVIDSNYDEPDYQEFLATTYHIPRIQSFILQQETVSKLLKET